MTPPHPQLEFIITEEQLKEFARLGAYSNNFFKFIPRMVAAIRSRPVEGEREKVLEWNSTRIIGNANERYQQLIRKKWEWSAFYNGWIEGRFAMLAELRAQQGERGHRA